MFVYFHFDLFFSLCVGVLWVLNHCIHGSPDVINRLQELGKRVYFITNNSTKSRSGFLEKAHTLGYNISDEGFISTSYAVAKFLEKRKFNKKVYLIGSTGISQELDNVGIKHTGLGPDVLNTSYNVCKRKAQPNSTKLLKISNSQEILMNFKLDPEVGAVVVGFDEHFSFPKMLKAANYLNDPECLFIATNTDERFPSKLGVVPGSGSIVRAVNKPAFTILLFSLSFLCNNCVKHIYRLKHVPNVNQL